MDMDCGQKSDAMRGGAPIRMKMWQMVGVVVVAQQAESRSGGVAVSWQIQGVERVVFRPSLVCALGPDHLPIPVVCALAKGVGRLIPAIDLWPHRVGKCGCVRAARDLGALGDAQAIGPAIRESVKLVPV